MSLKLNCLNTCTAESGSKINNNSTLEMSLFPLLLPPFLAHLLSFHVLFIYLLLLLSTSSLLFRFSFLFLFHSFPIFYPSCFPVSLLSLCLSVPFFRSWPHLPLLLFSFKIHDFFFSSTLELFILSCSYTIFNYIIAHMLLC